MLCKAIMNNKNGKICRFCLKSICEGNFDTIEEITKHMLDVLLLNLKLEITEQPIICNECSKNLLLSFDFKLRYLDANKIIPFEHSAENDDRKFTSVNENTKFCQICMKNTEEDCLSALYEFQDEFTDNIFMSDILQKHVQPNLDLNNPEQVVICTSCLESLQVLLRFSSNCLDVEENIVKYVDAELIDHRGQIELNNIQQFTFSMLRNDEIEMKHSIADKPEIKEEINGINEEITLKDEIQDFSEVDELKYRFEGNGSEMVIRQSDGQSYGDHTLSQSIRENISMYNPRDHVVTIQDFSEVRDNNLENLDETKAARKFRNSSDVPTYNCQNCSFVTKHKKSLIAHMLKHEVKVYMCESCPYGTKIKGNLKKHVLVHRELSKVPVYKCQSCTFRTRREKLLKAHLLTHQELSEVAVYTCESCWYVTNQKGNLRIHMLTHRKLSEVRVYSCESCSYVTKRKRSLNKHILTHQELSEVTVYKCEKCQFTTKHKGSLKTHNLTHRMSSEVTVYRCESCAFTTKHKVSLKSHMLTHRKLSEVPVYTCESCGFMTKYKFSLKSHMLTHQELSEIRVYACESCSYVARQKGTLKLHMLTHRDLSEITVYACERCSYVSRQKGNLKTHMLTHQTLSEVTVYRCESCPFATKRKGYLKSHMLTHQRKAGCM